MPVREPAPKRLLWRLPEPGSRSAGPMRRPHLGSSALDWCSPRPERALSPGSRWARGMQGLRSGSSSLGRREVLVPSPSGVKRQMLPGTATVPGPGLMIAARVRRLRSRSLRPGWPEHPLARLLMCLFPGMSPGSRSLRLGWQGCPLAQTLSCPNPGMPPNSRSLRPGWPERPLARTLTLNPVKWKLPERRPEAGPLSAGRVPWP
jgi:hypothetical protein